MESMAYAHLTNQASSQTEMQHWNDAMLKMAKHAVLHIAAPENPNLTHIWVAMNETCWVTL
jgi:hypothetical protein